jgi:hypothetical protein
MVDADGREVPWYDPRGRELGAARERFHPAPGQPFVLMGGGLVGGPLPPETAGHHIDPSLADRVRRGEVRLPLYADLPGLPAHERRAIFGLMVGNEGKSRVPVYQTYTQAGFDPDRDMLQAPIMPPDAYRSPHYPAGATVPQYRETFGGGTVVDWDLRTSLEGLYAAGRCIYGGGDHSGAASTGRYAGRRAAAAALRAAAVAVDEDQVAAERARVYEPLRERPGAIGWKELNAGICRVMQDHCGEYRGEETLRLGLRRLAELRESELARGYAANPHELGRLLECHTILSVAELIVHASLARRASCSTLDFTRLDYPADDPPEWRKLVTVRRAGAGGAAVAGATANGGVVVEGELPLDYFLRPPYASSYDDNYRAREAAAQ